MPKSNGQQPIARHGHRMVYDENRQMIILFGGMGADKQPLGDAWGWDGSRWFQLSSKGPSPRAWIRQWPFLWGYVGMGWQTVAAGQPKRTSRTRPH
jgi:hypothetical protein